MWLEFKPATVVLDDGTGWTNKGGTVRGILYARKKRAKRR